MKKRFLELALVLTMICTGIFGCANKGAQEAGAEVSTEIGAEGGSSENASGSTSDSASETTAQGEKTDRSGNPIEVPENVETIISMAPSTTQILIDLGLGDKIVACDTYSYGSYLADLKADIPQFDMMTPDQEKIVSLNADVVFTTGMSASHGEDVFASVKEAGICVCDIPSSASLADIEADILFIGDVVKKNDEAKKIVAEMQDSIAEIKNVAMNIKDDQKKTVLFELFTPSAESPTIYTAGSGTYITEMIELIGAENVAGKEKDDWPALTEEAAIAMDPQVILTADMYTDDVINVLLGMSGWENVTAIKDKAVYQIDNDTVNRPNHHVVSAMVEMAKAIYPEVYKDLEDPFANDNAKEEKPAA